MATTAITTTEKQYEFLPEIWERIKEYFITDPDYEWPSIYCVQLPEFYSYLDEEGEYLTPSKTVYENYKSYHLVVETNGYNRSTKAYVMKNLNAYRSRRIQLAAKLKDESKGFYNPETCTYEDKVRSEAEDWRTVIKISAILDELELQQWKHPYVEIWDFNLEIQLTERGPRLYIWPLPTR